MTFTMFVVVMAAMNGLGLASSLIARACLGTRWQALGHRFFWLCLCLVGLLTPLACTWGVAWCLVCGTTLAVMAVAAVVDFETTRGRQQFMETHPFGR